VHKSSGKRSPRPADASEGKGSPWLQQQRGGRDTERGEQSVWQQPRFGWNKGKSLQSSVTSTSPQSPPPSASQPFAGSSLPQAGAKPATDALARDPEPMPVSFTVTLWRNKCGLNNRCCIKHQKTRQISH